MGKKLPHTPNSRIRAALRKLFLRSRERAAAMKRDKYCCKECGVKQSRKKGAEVYVECDHIDGIDWEGLIALIRERILQTPDKLQTLCCKCHETKSKGVMNGEINTEAANNGAGGAGAVCSHKDSSSMDQRRKAEGVQDSGRALPDNDRGV